MRMKIKVDDTCIGILSALSDGQFHYADDFTIYKDEKRKKMANECDIVERIIGMESVGLITPDLVSGLAPIAMTEKGSEVLRKYTRCMNSTGRYPHSTIS
jgi:hypothetical protein